MQVYEIRILNSKGEASLIIEDVAASDAEALEDAEQVAQDNPYEVWKDLERIKSADAAHAKAY